MYFTVLSLSILPNNSKYREQESKTIVNKDTSFQLETTVTPNVKSRNARHRIE